MSLLNKLKKHALIDFMSFVVAVAITMLVMGDNTPLLEYGLGLSILLLYLGYLSYLIWYKKQSCRQCGVFFVIAAIAAFGLLVGLYLYLYEWINLK